MIKRITLVFVALMFLVSCAGPGSVRDLSEEYVTVKGRLAGPPKLENGDKHLILYIEEESQAEDERQILVCATENGDNKRLLRELSENILLDESAPLFLYGQKVDGSWKEYIDGIDFEIIAIGYSVPDAERYVVIYTAYGNRLADAFRSVGWSGFLKMVAKAGMKAVAP